MIAPRLLWDIGTAYDFFESLEVLHRPAEFGVRGSWAAGVRARLPEAARQTLEQALTLLPGPPLHWVYRLPEPKDAATVLWVLGRLSPADRLRELASAPKVPNDVRELLQAVAARQGWGERDREFLLQHARTMGQECYFKPGEVTDILEGWSRAEDFGERYLEALKMYHEAFFAEEEKRIQPALEQALAGARELAQQLALPDLLEELSQGLRFSELPEMSELVLVPCYWTTPFMIFGYAVDERAIWLFGAKPAEASLVPGEVVPDALLRALKALADPTRLRILRYLSDEPLTPVELARRLRLRAPTVTHHLRTLRAAGLLHLTVVEIKGKDRDVYAMRHEAVKTTYAALKGFLHEGGAKSDEE